MESMKCECDTDTYFGDWESHECTCVRVARCCRDALNYVTDATRDVLYTNAVLLYHCMYLYVRII